MLTKKIIAFGFFAVTSLLHTLFAQTEALLNQVNQLAEAIEPKVIEWRRHFSAQERHI